MRTPNNTEETGGYLIPFFVDIPANRFEEFKNRWWPMWLRRLWPVKTRRLDTQAELLCIMEKVSEQRRVLSAHRGAGIVNGPSE